MHYHFWLREEVKEGEKRTPLLPEHAKKLLESGHKVTVERSSTRCIPDVEYERVGCSMAAGGSWVHSPLDTIILGLKELPETQDPLVHTHIYFAHCYKNQAGWQDILRRFIRGKGKLWDLEFLVDSNGRRIAAFGYSAGLVGVAVGLKQWAQLQHDKNSKLGTLRYYSSSEELVADVKADLKKVKDAYGVSPSVFVMGALGRCGRGAVWFAQQCGITSITQWDIEETRKGGPFPEILTHDVFVNCIYLSAPIPPFINNELLNRDSRKLTVLVDVSCDTSNPNNPVPVYSQTTTFLDPVLKTRTSGTPFDVIAIDHLPSLVPSESSREFASALFSHLEVAGQTDVWHRANALFLDKIKLVPASN